MIIVLFFEDIIYFEILSKGIKSSITNKFGDKFYAVNSPAFFELGFYNWIVYNDQLLGINFQLMNKQDELLPFFRTKNYSNLDIEDNHINIFIEKQTDYMIDFSNEFVNFVLLKCADGQRYAVTFEIPDDFEYEIPQALRSL